MKKEFTSLQVTEMHQERIHRLASHRKSSSSSSAAAAGAS
jgi:hypothetical protein